MADSATDDASNVLQKYQEGRDRLRYLKKLRSGMSVLLVFVLIVSLWLLYGKVESQYKVELFEEPVNIQAKRLAGPFQAEAVKAMHNLQPVYARELKKSMDKIEPQLRADAVKELRSIAESLNTGMREQLRQSLNRIYNKQFNEMAKHFPTLTDSERKELFKKRLEKDLKNDIDSLLVDFEKMYVRDLKAVESTVNQFRPNRFERFTKEELGRYFVHLWIMMLDHQFIKVKEGQKNG